MTVPNAPDVTNLGEMHPAGAPLLEAMRAINAIPFDVQLGVLVILFKEEKFRVVCGAEFDIKSLPIVLRTIAEDMEKFEPTIEYSDDAQSPGNDQFPAPGKGTVQ